MNATRTLQGIFPLTSFRRRVIPKEFRSHRFTCGHDENHHMEDLLKYLESLKNYEKCGMPKGAATDTDEGFDMGRMKRLMERLDNPHRRFKAVHIAGTKGKGSTAAFLTNILEKEGYSVGSYTSPHVWDIRERISLGRFGDAVSAEKLGSLYAKWRSAVENEGLTHFEVLTGLAYALFAQERVDIAVIEVGLGGARDATNVLSESEVIASVITNIGEEHLSALGGSLEAIALAKSGVIKPGRPVVVGGPFLPRIERIIRQRAESMCSPVITTAGGGILKGTPSPVQLCDIDAHSDSLRDVRLRMIGPHQLRNAVVAYRVALCLRNQGWKVSEESVRAGLESTRVPGRFQFLDGEQVEALGLPGTAVVVVDGAHTRDSARALAQTVRTAFPDRNVGLAVAMAGDKDHVGFAAELLSGIRPVAVCLTETAIAGDPSRAAPASLLLRAWLLASDESGIKNVAVREDTPVRSVIRLHQILETGATPCDQSPPNNVIVVTGSVHLLSHLLPFGNKHLY